MRKDLLAFSMTSAQNFLSYISTTSEEKSRVIFGFNSFAEAFFLDSFEKIWLILLVREDCFLS
jgi:hypothetical protein